MDPSEVKQMMEHLVTRLEAQIGSHFSRMEAQIGRLATKMDSNQERMNADKEESKADKEELMARMDSNQEKTETAINSLRSCLGGTGACLEEEEELTPKETDAVEEPQVVPEGAAVEDKFGATEDQTGELRLAMRRHRQRRKRAQENGGPRPKFAAFRG
jgi:chromosome segregation ATPase